VTRNKTLLNLKFSALNLEELGLQMARGQVEHGVAYHLVNAYTTVLAQENSALGYILQKDILICDGISMSILCKTQMKFVNHIRGADLMRYVTSINSNSARHFVLGGKRDVLDDLMTSLKKNNPAINIVGRFSPPFKDDFSEDYDTWAEVIGASGANIVWVGLGTPKQDFIVHALAKRLDSHVIAVGAAFDYLAGHVKESPIFFQIFGLEWMFRLFAEPKRLWKRYLIGNFKFLRLAIARKIKIA
jgi:N-acetylglucosaminyldiphosphoundecaprenol N-acetyl-beta-D-mannosaminyltransferase